MRLAYYIKSERLRSDSGVSAMLASLESAGFELVRVDVPEDLEPSSDMLLSIGGDGTFLSAAHAAAGMGVPVLGVNFGRLGFLSENDPDSVVQALTSGEYSLEERTMLHVCFPGGEALALNEVSVSRIGAAMLGVDIALDGNTLPTYWADGLLVATSSGSTAYAMSVGGPICTPDAPVLVIAPIAPHNLNVRPLVVPDTSSFAIAMRSRDARVRLTVDNRNFTITPDCRINVRASGKPLRRVVLGSSNFINALRGRLLWGEDVRNFIEKETV